MAKPLFRGKQLKVRVLRRHFNKSLEVLGTKDLQVAYGSVTNCPIAQAMIEKFPERFFSVGCGNISFKDENGSYSHLHISNSSAEVVYENKPFTVTLTRYEDKV